jgi:hypothetical protein
MAKGFLLRAYQAQLLTKEELQQLGRASLARITSGQGKEVVNWSSSGSSFGKTLYLTPDALLDECTTALRWINGDTGKSVYSDFRYFHLTT